MWVSLLLQSAHFPKIHGSMLLYLEYRHGHSLERVWILSKLKTATGVVTVPSSQAAAMGAGLLPPSARGPEQPSSGGPRGWRKTDCAKQSSSWDSGIARLCHLARSHLRL